MRGRQSGRAADSARRLPDSARAWQGSFCAGRASTTSPYWLVGGRDAATCSPRRASRGPRTRRPRGAVVLRFRFRHRATHDRKRFDVATPIVYRYADPIRGDVSRPLAFVPEISVTLDRAIEYAPARTPARQAAACRAAIGSDVRARRARDASAAGGPSRRFGDAHGDAARVWRRCAARRSRFAASCPPGRHTIAVVAESNGKQIHERLHGDRVRSHPPAAAVPRRDASRSRRWISRCRLTRSSRTSRASATTRLAMLQQLGLRVTMLNPADIPKTDLIALQRDRRRHARVRVERRAGGEQRRAARLREARRDDGRAVRPERDAEARASCRTRSR